MIRDLGYKGNPLIKPAGETYDFTLEQMAEYKKCMAEPIYFCRKYVKIVNVDKGLIPFDLYDYQERIINTIHNNRFTICKLPRQSGKCILTSSLISTPSGWTTISDLQIGDMIFGTDGYPIEVLGKSPVFDDHICYKVHFDSGDPIVADAEHLWEIYSSDWTKDNSRRVMETQDIIHYVNRERSGGRPYIKLPDPVQYEEKQYTIPPYILGMWLGDGDKNSGKITCDKKDFVEYEKMFPKYNEELLSHREDGREDKPNTYYFTIKNLTTRLRLLGVQNNKHIPESYMFGSVEQRFELLRGLVDTDGYSKPKDNSYEFYQKSKEFCEDVREILASLGIKSRLRSKIVNDETYHIVSFATDKQVCNLPRKMNAGKGKLQRPEQSRLYITKIEEHEIVPMQCIEVDSKDSLFLAGRHYTPTHNSSSIGCGNVLHFVLFNENKKVAILANKEKSAKKLLADIKKGFEYLPKWLQQGVVEWNKTSVVFENGSSILVSATSADSARGDSYSMIVLDEFAFIGENQADEFFKSVYPTISSGKETKMIIVSTPNGMNHFYKMWMDAIEGRSEFVPIEINWWDTPGRDEAWKAKEIANTDERTFAQEYICQFFGSTNTLLSGSCLKSLAHVEPLKQSGDGLDIYDEPIEGHEYVMCVDVASGNGMDYSAFAVIDVSQYPYKLVAKYRNNEVSTMIFPQIIHGTATQYNEAWVLIELNQDGGQVSNDLHDDFEYENMIYVTPRGRKGQVATLEGFGKKIQYGVKTSVATKRIGCSMIKTIMEDKKLVVQDYDTIHEFSSFVSKKKSYQAEEGRHDDLVLCLVLFGWLTSQDVFNEMLDTNVKEAALDERRKRQEDLMTPMGFFEDGVDETEEPEDFVDESGQFWKALKEYDDEDDFNMNGFFY